MNDDIRQLLLSLCDEAADSGFDPESEHDLDEVESRARHVYRELRDLLELVWRAQEFEFAENETPQDAMALRFVESTQSNPTATVCCVQLQRELIEFHGWDRLGDDEQGLSVVLSAFNSSFNGKNILPTVRFSQVGYLATVTAFECLPAYFQKVLLRTLKQCGCVYVPYEDLQQLHEGCSWWERFF